MERTPLKSLVPFLNGPRSFVAVLQWMDEILHHFETMGNRGCLQGNSVHPQDAIQIPARMGLRFRTEQARTIPSLQWSG